MNRAAPLALSSAFQESTTTFNFIGTETCEGGTGDFDDIFGTGDITGGTLTITAPGSGGWAVAGIVD
jgi:hypothetical protein